MEDYKGNSHKMRREAKTADGEKKIEKVVTGAARTKKKSEIRKLTDVFISDDISSVKSYIIADIMIPAVKRFISDTVDAILYPGGSGGKKHSAASKVSYGGYYKNSSDRREVRAGSRGSSGFDYDDILFDNRGDAEAVLNAMDDIIDQFGTVSVADMYDMAEVSTTNFALNKYGWADIRSGQVVRVRDGKYMLKLPRALPLNTL